MPTSKPIAERFHEKYKVNEETGCWEWTGATVTGGYGQIKLPKQRKQIRAHRLSYELHKGPVPKHIEVCHSCDNPPCVNPDHLFLGTRLENRLDMKAKGRSTWGEKNSQAKLTEVQVGEIRRLVASGVPQIKVAMQFNIGKMQVSRIVRGERWARSMSPEFAVSRRSPRIKLSVEDIRQIRILAAGGFSQNKLAVQFGVSQTHVGRIVRSAHSQEQET